jgi:hypothetical protein
VLSTRPNSTDVGIDELVQGRMQRQAVLTREKPSLHQRPQVARRSHTDGSAGRGGFPADAVDDLHGLFLGDRLKFVLGIAAFSGVQQ